MTRIFISHSHSDEAIAYKLVTFLLAALRLEDEDILCTSNPDQGLSYGSSSITDQLKNQLKNSEALIVLITADSLHSAWIPFEAGSFWTTDKTIIPILGPGLTQNDLSGPLKSFLSIPIEVEDVEDKLNNAINQLVKNLNLQQKVTKRRNDTLREFANSLKAWQSKRPEIDLSQQEEIERLKARIQELEQLYSNQLQEIEATSQQNKEELEKNYQNQKQELEQSLQSQISELVQKLAKVSSHNQQLKQLNRRQLLKWAGFGGVGLFTGMIANEVLNGQLSKSESTISIAEIDCSTFETVTVDQKGEIVERDSNKQAKFFKEDLGNGANLEMVYIPGGKFLRGTEDEEIERLKNNFKDKRFRSEEPQLQVTLQPFFMGKFQVTQAQWKVIASLSKVEQDLEHEYRDNELPVDRVSWKDAVEFCLRLRKLTGKEYRLPSEAQWEYACRAGTTTPFYFGETITSQLANYRGSSIYASEPKGEYRKKTTAVGSFKPNAFGLHDMHGNLWEWCQDNWYENYRGAPVNGDPRLSGDKDIKVVRGGSWDNAPVHCRSAYRDHAELDGRSPKFGFRVICNSLRTT